MNRSPQIIEISFSCGMMRQYRASTLAKIPYFNDIFIEMSERGENISHQSYYLPILFKTFNKVLDYAETRSTKHIESNTEYIVLIELLVMFHFLTKSEAIDRIATYMMGGCVGSTEVKALNRRHSSDSNRSRRNTNLSDLYVPRWDPLEPSFLEYKTIHVNVRGYKIKTPYKLLQKECPIYFSTLYNPDENQSLSEDRGIRIENDCQRDNFIDMEPKNLGYLIEYLLFPGLSQLSDNFDVFCQNILRFNPQISSKNSLLNQRLKLH